MSERVILCFALLVYAPTASAEAAFQFSAPNLRIPEDPDVNGFRLSLFHGQNNKVRGFDLGLLSISESSDFSGVSLVVGVSKVTGGRSDGASISIVNHHSGSDTGMNAAFINKLNHAPNAFNVSFFNIADGSTMLDLGGVNFSDRSEVQLGFVNMTNEIKSFQFGFINIAKNGFLPVFPVINFPKN